MFANATPRLAAMHQRFAGCADPNIANWDTSEVTDMSFLFYNLKGPIPDISNWNTSNVTNMESMFEGCTYLPDISGWNTTNVTNMKNFVFC